MKSFQAIAMILLTGLVSLYAESIIKENSDYAVWEKSSVVRSDEVKDFHDLNITTKKIKESSTGENPRLNKTKIFTGGNAGN